MKKILLILPQVLALKCFGQHETKEDFVNEVALQYVTLSHGYYYLLRNVYATTLDSIDYDNGQIIDSFSDSHYQNYNKLSSIIPEESIEELITISRKDSSRNHWDSSHLKNVKFYNDRHGDDINDTAYSSSIYSFAWPAFDIDHNYAVMWMKFYCGPICGEYCIYFFKKTEGKWKVIAKTSCLEY